MNKELQDKAWSVLPKEFKEEVKKYFAHYRCALNTHEAIINHIFGRHNLTSDSEGEEMLMVPRSQMQKLYASTKKVNDPSSKDYINGILNTLDTLFGSKCLPDEVAVAENATTTEPKSAEPKYHKGEKVRYNGYVYEVEGLVGKNRYALKGLNFDLDEDMIEPYTEQKEVAKMKPIESKISVCLATKEEDEEFRQFLHENGFKWNSNRSLISLSCWSSYIEDSHTHYVYPDKTVTYYGDKTSDTLTFSEFKKQYFGEESRNLSQETANCDKHFDNILKDSFSKERRLNIAAMAMQGILSNPTAMNGPKLIDGDEEILAKWSLKFADALIAECELTEKLKGE